MKPKLPNNCEVGCKHYTGGEMKHTPGCINYPDSLSRQFDENETRIQQLEAELLASRNFAVEIDKEHTKTIEGYENNLRKIGSEFKKVREEYEKLKSNVLEELKKRDEKIELLKGKVKEYEDFTKWVAIGAWKRSMYQAQAEKLIKLNNL